MRKYLNNLANYYHTTPGDLIGAILVGIVTVLVLVAFWAFACTGW